MDFLDFDISNVSINLKILRDKDQDTFWLCPCCLSVLENFLESCEFCESKKD